MNACRNSKSPALISRATGENCLRGTLFCLTGSNTGHPLRYRSQTLQIRQHFMRTARNADGFIQIPSIAAAFRLWTAANHGRCRKGFMLCGSDVAVLRNLGVNYRTSSSNLHRRDWRSGNGNVAHGNPALSLQPGRASVPRPRMPKPLIPPVRHPNKGNPASSREDNSAGTFGLYSRVFPALVRLAAFSKSKRIR